MADAEEFTVEYYTAPLVGSGVPGMMEDDGDVLRSESPMGAPATPTVPTPATLMALASPTSGAPAGMEFCSPPTDASAVTDEAPRCYRMVANTLATTMPMTSTMMVSASLHWRIQQVQ
ncbi:hypothetical protein E2562_000526 [Oryza meyeriana var. granulata]|uniref:Uncharacterized protein n=1 Tax=Oryza meyeriana var. granulata TaxID=110450 RepID=A0A6G1CCF3_9ORYZ|nr:hypothetical protein E2562_000526 [Oryza meyeriana var. granulata]